MTGELCERCGVRLAVDDGYCRPCARVLDGPAATGGRPGHWLPRAARLARLVLDLLEISGKI